MKKLTVAPWLKCVMVLLFIALFSGGLLAALNDLLAVPNSERTMRAIKKIYGEEKEYSVVIGENDAITCGEFGTINIIYRIEGENAESYDLLFNATGEKGYKNGTVTLWVRVKCEGDTNEIVKTVLGDFTKQTLMSKLGAEFYDGFANPVGDEYFTAKADEEGVKNVVSGATFSASAADNAVNCVIYWLRGNAK